MKKKFLKFLTTSISVIIATGLLLTAGAVFAYLKVLPAALSNPKVISYIEKTIKEQTNFDTKIEAPVLKTSLKPEIELSLGKLEVLAGKNVAFDLRNFDTKISFAQILNKKIQIEKVNLDYVYTDVNKLMAMLPPSTEEKPKSDWNIDVFHSVLNINDAIVLYKPDKLTSLKLSVNNVKISDNVEKKVVNYNVIADITKGKNLVRIKTSDKNSVYIKEMQKLFVDYGEILVNNSNIIYHGSCDSKSNFDFNFKSKKFSIPEVLALLDSQIVENNLSELLVYFKDINGNFDFDVNISNTDLNGKINLNKLAFKLVPFADLPILLNSGKVSLNSNKVDLKDFKGYYNNKPANKMSFDGVVDDYMKSVATNLEGDAVITNDFSRNYLSKMIGYPIGIEGVADTRIKLKSVYNKFDLVWLCRFKKGNGFIIDGEETFMNDAANRVMAAKMHFEDTLLNIKSINYYAGNPEDDREEVRVPILSMNGNIDFANGQTFVKDFGFSLPKPMPSGFLNALIKQKLFKGGTLTGNMRIINTAKYPYLEGDMKAEKVAIPSQRLFIKNGEFKADNGLLHIASNGRFRRSAYGINGAILNEIKLPIVVKDASFEIDKIDVERYLQLFNNQKPSDEAAEIQVALANSAAIGGDVDDDDNAQTFDLANLIIEKCILKANSGFYKGINFSDVEANLTLDKDSMLKIESNRFNIAEGISSAKIDCDLRKHLYNIKLGIKDVNSDIIATSLLNLPKEIDGKASGLISLNTDDSLKLNGKILFRVKHGIIGKVGLVEYLMKVASLFRNPLTMISPTTVSDLVNIPEGRFDLIEGELILKDNIVLPMKIKSSAAQLSSYIIGTYNLENQDAALRIYTKFSSRKKGVYGFFRNFSLNALANRMPLSSRNDSNYYEAELSQIPPIEADEKDCQIFLTKVDGDIEHNNFISSLKKIK